MSAPDTKPRRSATEWVDIFLTGLAPLSLLVVWPLAITTCLPQPYDESLLGYPIGVAQAAHFAATQNDPPMCGDSGAAQLLDGRVVRCRLPFAYHGPRARGLARVLETMGGGVIPSQSLRHAPRLSERRLTARGILSSEALAVPRDARVAALLALHPSLADRVDLLDAPDDDVLMAIGHERLIRATELDAYEGYGRLTRFDFDTTTILYDHERKLVVTLEVR